MSPSSNTNGQLRKDILRRAREILKDGQPRTAKQVAAMLVEHGIVVHKSLVNSVLSIEGRDTYYYDITTYTYTLIQQVPANRAPRSATITAKPASKGSPPALGQTQLPPKFAVRNKVRLTANPRRRGTIIDIRSYAGQFSYCLVMGDDELWFAERDLELIPREGLPRWQPRDAFLRDLLLTKLRSRLTDNLYAHGASRTQFVPYQFRPALKFLRNPDQRILIADEVGLGKTIEAAIIYLELKARLNISRVLVLCPSRLKNKWHDELRNRFEEEFVELDTVRLRAFLADSRRLGGKFPFRAIASFEMMRSPEFIEAWTEHHIPLDLLIVDEAHYMRNADTRTYQLGTALTDTADAVVFLTATPLHLRNRDLYNLLHLLTPGEFNDPVLFESLMEPNAAINLASKQLGVGDRIKAASTLMQVRHTALHDRFQRNPYYTEIVRKLMSGPLEAKERVALQRDILELNTLSTVFTRTRKREVETAAVRAAYTLRVELTAAERQFYDGILEHLRHELSSARGGAPSFAVIMKERQAASCLAAMREMYDETPHKRGPIRLKFERSTFDSFGSDDDQVMIDPRRLLELSRHIGNVDSKFDLFETTLREALRNSPDSKVLVFSFFRRTLGYLHRRLKAQGYQVEVLNGDVPVPERKHIIDRFRNDPEFRILLSSEVGAEGLDFQFCDILVNYDLPWNPMQVEQRIGRLDRFGQTHERIRIYNFCIAETIETRIFERLYERIGIFQSSIGDLEAILGDEIRKLTEAALQAKLTPLEQSKLAEQAADRIMRRQVEADALDHEKDQLLGQQAILNQQIEDTVNGGRTISAQEVTALVQTFLTEKFPSVQFVCDADEPCWTLRLDQTLMSYLQQFTDGQGHDQSLVRFWEALQGNSRVPLTFSSEFARQRSLLEFITVRHPLARAAIDYWEQKGLGGVPAARIEVHGPPNEQGDGYFYVYQLDVLGARPQTTLYPILILDNGQIAAMTAETLLRQMQHSAKFLAELSVAEEDFLRVEAQAALQVAQERDHLKDEAERRNAAIVAAQKASVTTSFEAKIRRAQEQSVTAVDERIRRMRSGQVNNLRSSMLTKLAELEQGVNVSVSYKLVLGGRIRVVTQ